MTAQQSLSLITETLNNSRKEITRGGGKYFILWGCLLTLFSLLVYCLWKTTDKAAWNNLWFAMPVIGFVLERIIRRKDAAGRVQNDVSRILGGIWASFGIFAVAVSAFTVIYTQINPNPLGTIAVVVGLTAEIVLLFGLAECISGVALKNWAIRIAGLVTDVGGLIIYYVANSDKEQLLIFTFAGIVLAVTGLIMKNQKK
ncbi:MAG: hypothetical protein IJK05_04390 [Bacteroidales bacterium]|nr:hypothetical protein [Bacteroidales bacterium]